VPRQIALLRGVNVGGNTMVGMAPLRAVFADLGHTDIKTYVNSGNVVFSGRAASAGRIEKAIKAEFDLDVPVVLRTRDEIAAVHAHDPLHDVATNPARYLVMFGDRPLDPAKADDIDADAVAPEAFAIHGREAYLWLPDGVRNSPLTKAITERRFGVRLTGRNWRTVGKLLELADAAD
jgi:uncharacterized protein (DUF1697 family)